MAKNVTLEIIVTVPDEDSEKSIEDAINEALDEPPCSWGNWSVGCAHVKSVEKIELADEYVSPYEDD